VTTEERLAKLESRVRQWRTATGLLFLGLVVVFMAGAGGRVYDDEIVAKRLVLQTDPSSARLVATPRTLTLLDGNGEERLEVEHQTNGRTSLGICGSNTRIFLVAGDEGRASICQDTPGGQMAIDGSPSDVKLEMRTPKQWPAVTLSHFARGSALWFYDGKTGKSRLGLKADDKEASLELSDKDEKVLFKAPK